MAMRNAFSPPYIEKVIVKVRPYGTYNFYVIYITYLTYKTYFLNLFNKVFTYKRQFLQKSFVNKLKK